MTFFYTDTYHVNLPKGHKFPMTKYAAVRQTLLVNEIITPVQLQQASLIKQEILYKAHSETYIEQVFTCTLPAAMVRRIGFDWNISHLRRARASVGGTIAALHSAITTGTVAGTLAGGTHHAGRDFGEGFCVFNDLAVATGVFLEHFSNKKVAIIDADVHHGNGTADIWGNHSSVFIADIYCEQNYPLQKIPVHKAYPLAIGVGDREYIHAIESALQEMHAFQPDVLLYQAGVDVLLSDALGKLHVSMNGLQTRDSMILEFCRNNSIPCVITLGGGYAQPLQDTINAHVQTIKTATSVYFS